MCENDGACGECRPCRLIDKEAYADCDFYPKDGDKIKTADIDDLVSKTIIRPIESDIRMFVLVGAENMTAEAQNKILKTLEEPPRNVCILIGATTDNALLPTVKSRVKRLDVPPFSDGEIRRALGDEYPDKAKLESAIALGGGKIGSVIKAYTDGNAEKMQAFCREVLFSMRSSKDVAKYSSKINKDNIKDFISILKSEVANLLVKDNRKAEDYGYVTGALIAISDMLSEKERALYYNANAVMVADSVLLAILGEKYKWQKL
jgi:DNA polymerase-3 subunit delta'